MLRRRETDAERILWSVLRNRQLEGHKFVRQYPVGNYIADFACREAMLVIELDGSRHVDSPTDVHRTAYLVSNGYTVLRIWNNDISQNLQGVAEAILAAISDRPSPGQRFALATLSPEGRGEAVAPPETIGRRKK